MVTRKNNLHREFSTLSLTGVLTNEEAILFICLRITWHCNVMVCKASQHKVKLMLYVHISLRNVLSSCASSCALEQGFRDPWRHAGWLLLLVVDLHHHLLVFPPPLLLFLRPLLLLPVAAVAVNSAWDFSMLSC